MYRLSLFCCLLVAVLLAQGCSGDPNVRPSVEISGTVTLDGAPLQQASIQFTSSKSGESAYANLDENGNYSAPECTSFDIRPQPLTLAATSLSRHRFLHTFSRGPRVRR